MIVRKKPLNFRDFYSHHLPAVNDAKLLLLRSLPKNDYFSNFIFLELLRHIEQKSLFNRTKDVFSTSSIVRAESLSIRSSSCCQLCLVCFDWLKILGKYSRLSVLVTKESMEFGSCQGTAVHPYILWPLNWVRSFVALAIRVSAAWSLSFLALHHEGTQILWIFQWIRKTLQYDHYAKCIELIAKYRTPIRWHDLCRLKFNSGNRLNSGVRTNLIATTRLMIPSSETRMFPLTPRGKDARDARVVVPSLSFRSVKTSRRGKRSQVSLLGQWSSSWPCAMPKFQHE